MSETTKRYRFHFSDPNDYVCAELSDSHISALLSDSGVRPRFASLGGGYRLAVNLDNVTYIEEVAEWEADY